MILDGANDLIQLVTDAAADIEVSVSWAHNNAGVITVSGLPKASITTAATTTLIPAAGASQQRNGREISIFNNHATTPCTCTVQRTDGTNTVNLKQVVLASKESLLLGENGIWVYYDPTGKPYMGLGPIATQAEMEAGTSLTTMVTPGRMQYHPGVAKFWLYAGVAGNILASYNVTSLTDTGTGVMAITIGTDFSSVNWCCLVSVEAPATTWAVANTRECHVRNATIAAGTVSVDCIDNTATTSLVKDPSSWHVMGFGDQA